MPTLTRRFRYALALTTLTLTALAASFGPGQEIARFPAELDEISGLAQSRSNPNIFWVHNDSGDQPRVYAVNRNGKLVGTFLLEGATAVDWEDMAIGPAPNQRSYLYLADIGDNSGNRTSVKIYRVLEPRVRENQKPVSEKLSGALSFEFKYEDGPRDAEGFMVDPLTNDFYVVTKREITGNRLYRSTNPSSSKLNTFTLAVTFPFVGVTGADISPDGLQVLIRRYSSATSTFAPPATAASYWSRPDGSVSIPDLLKQPGKFVALLPEVQGEAIAFAADNKGFYTTSERGPGGVSAAPAPLNFYPLLPDHH